MKNFPKKLKGLHILYDCTEDSELVRVKFANNDSPKSLFIQITYNENSVFYFFERQGLSLNEKLWNNHEVCFLTDYDGNIFTEEIY